MVKDCCFAQSKLRKRTSWCFSIWESTCHCRRHGFHPWSGKIPRAVEQLSACTQTLCHSSWSLCTLESTCLNYRACVLQLLKPEGLEPVLCHRGSLRTHRKEGWSLLAGTRKSECSSEDQRSQSVNETKPECLGGRRKISYCLAGFLRIALSP